MLVYFDMSIANTLRQTLGGFGVVYVLAFLLWLVSRKRRNDGAGIMGRVDYYLVVPGMVFHERSHTMGCWLTLTRVHKVVLFEIKDGHFGYVVHSQPSGRVLGPIKHFIIARGLCGWAVSRLSCWDVFSPVLGFPHLRAHSWRRNA